VKARAPRASSTRFRSSVTLRPYQKTAKAQAWKHKRGVIVAPTGAGKTEIALGLVAQAGVPALVLVHTRDLVDQWAARARKSLPRARVATSLDDGAADLVVTTIQGLYAGRLRLGRRLERIGLLIVDEAHHVPADTWRTVIELVPAPRRYGFTATPSRADGREGELFEALGPIVAEVAPDVVEAAGAVLVPVVRFYATRWSPRSADPRAELATSGPRNRRIVDLVTRQVRDRRRVLVLVERIDHVEALVAGLQGAGVATARLDGTLTREDRRAALASIRSGRASVLVATSLADEALDVPLLDTLVLAVSCGVEGRTQQRIGRILRPGDKAPPVVWDLVDLHAPWHVGAIARDELYRNRGWTVEAVTRRIS
jgi:superfamily II DNA or RNA helicase